MLRSFIASAYALWWVCQTQGKTNRDQSELLEADGESAIEEEFIAARTPFGMTCALDGLAKTRWAVIYR